MTPLAKEVILKDMGFKPYNTNPHNLNKIVEITFKQEDKLYRILPLKELKMIENKYKILEIIE